MTDSVFRRTVSFSTAAVTNYHKLSDLKQHRCLAFHSGGQESTWRRGRTAPSADSRENRLLETAGTPGLGGLTSGHSTLYFCVTAPSVAACLVAHFSRCCDDTVPAHQTTQDNRNPLIEAVHKPCPHVRRHAHRLGRGGPGRFRETLFCLSQGLPHLSSTKF